MCKLPEPAYTVELGRECPTDSTLTITRGSDGKKLEADIETPEWKILGTILGHDKKEEVWGGEYTLALCEVVFTCLLLQESCYNA